MSRFARSSKNCDFSCVAKNRKYFPNTSLINFSKNLVYLSQILSDQESPCSRNQRPHKAWEGGSKSSRTYYAHFWTKTVNNCGLCATHASLISLASVHLLWEFSSPSVPSVASHFSIFAILGEIAVFVGHPSTSTWLNYTRFSDYNIFKPEKIIFSLRPVARFWWV